MRVRFTVAITTDPLESEKDSMRIWKHSESKCIDMEYLPGPPPWDEDEREFYRAIMTCANALRDAARKFNDAEIKKALDTEVEEEDCGPDQMNFR